MSSEAFEAWWEKEGQFCRAGGGDYEKTFAFRAYESATAAALEEAAEVCRKLDKEGKPDNPEYGSWGEFDDAEQAIRALKEQG